jgi:hypothetical protein
VPCRDGPEEESDVPERKRDDGTRGHHAPENTKLQAPFLFEDLQGRTAAADGESYQRNRPVEGQVTPRIREQAHAPDGRPQEHQTHDTGEDAEEEGHVW